MKNRNTLILLTVFFGLFGVHRFYAGKILSGLLYLFTLGLFGVGWIVDLFIAVSGGFTDRKGYPITPEDGGKGFNGPAVTWLLSLLGYTAALTAAFTAVWLFAACCVPPVRTVTVDPTRIPVPETAADRTLTEPTAEPASAPPLTSAPPTAPAEEEAARYVLNHNTMRFHYPTCEAVAEIRDKNREDVEKKRSEIVADGYRPCGICRP